MNFSINEPWEKIFLDNKIHKHNFAKEPYYISAKKIKKSCLNFKDKSQKSIRLLCKQNKRSDRPTVFIENDLFLLRVKSGHYAIIQGEGYVDIPPINTDCITYKSKLSFVPETSLVGDSEMQHLDFAYAASLIRTFMNDDSLILTIRGRKYTPEFSFLVGTQRIKTESVQTEVDAGYEGKDKIVLIEAKKSNASDTIIRQLFYPFKQWSDNTSKQVETIFFSKSASQSTYSIWHFGFKDKDNYNSIHLIKSAKYKIAQ